MVIEYSNKYAHVQQFTDGEDIDAIERFFWNQSNGVVIELGALVDEALSMTKSMLSIGWHRILVEGNPKFREGMLLHSNDSAAYNTAVCRNARKVHFSDAAGVGGILEFMTEHFRSMFHKETTWLPVEDWYKIKNVHATYCLLMHAILNEIGISHVNLWLLDVEGAELEILATVYWHRVKFDIICIESEELNRPINFLQNVTDLLAHHSYELVWQYGRNSWFKHKDFKPFTRREEDRYTREDKFKNYHEGTVVKLEGHRNKAMYIIKDKKKHLIPNYDTYLSLKVSDSSVAVLSQAAFDIIDIGDPYPSCTNC